MVALRIRYHQVGHHQKVIPAKQTGVKEKIAEKNHDTNECLQDLHTRASKRISQGRHTRTILKQEPPPPRRRSTKACQAPLRVHFLKIFMEGKDP